MAKGHTMRQYYHEGSSDLRPVKPQGPGFENNGVKEWEEQSVLPPPVLSAVR